eukprot:m.59947 g.59947  ORF g.59947 m.59947 type:complete len:550 (-) comp7925_c0_seq1:99-1748(-)
MRVAEWVLVTAMASVTLPATVAMHPFKHSSSACHQDDSHPYASRWNTTTNLVCQPSTINQTRVCIVGAGVAGIHLAWLLARRGYTNLTVFESTDHVGGKAWTLSHGVPGDATTRDVGAEFLSPDYYETLALVRRFNLTLLPLSSSTDTRVHVANGSAIVPSAWYNERVANITGTTNASENQQTVADAMARYVALHHSIFGPYTGRLPPEPTPDGMQQLTGTVSEFLTRNNLTVLEPFMFNFFVMQGQGLLSEHPAWYALRWANPASIAAPPFNNNPDTYSAVIKQGMGGIVTSLLHDANLTEGSLRLNTTVTAITRGGSPGSTVRVTHRPTASEDGGPDETTTTCDVLALTGPIPMYVRGSQDGTIKPIVKDPTPMEQSLFAPQVAMQWLDTVVNVSPTPTSYRDVEYFPTGYMAPQGAPFVVVHRNMAYRETNTSGSVGGIMSFADGLSPLANRTTHWQATERWAARQGFSIEHVFAQLWVDTYGYHYPNGSDIVAGKPWRIWDAVQLLPGVSTLYAGGGANYETVEDCLYFNLYLVNRFFDGGHVPP